MICYILGLCLLKSNQRHRIVFCSTTEFSQLGLGQSLFTVGQIKCVQQKLVSFPKTVLKLNFKLKTAVIYSTASEAGAKRCLCQPVFPRAAHNQRSLLHEDLTACGAHYM